MYDKSKCYYSQRSLPPGAPYNLLSVNKLLSAGFDNPDFINKRLTLHQEHFPLDKKGGGYQWTMKPSTMNDMWLRKANPNKKRQRLVRSQVTKTQMPGGDHSIKRSIQKPEESFQKKNKNSDQARIGLQLANTNLLPTAGQGRLENRQPDAAPTLQQDFQFDTEGGRINDHQPVRARVRQPIPTRQDTTSWQSSLNPERSSESDLPTCTIAVIPRWKKAKYMNLLKHQNVRVISRFARDTFTFIPPDSWSGARKAGKAKWQVMILEIANTPGRTRYLTGRPADITVSGCTFGATPIITPCIDTEGTCISDKHSEEFTDAPTYTSPTFNPTNPTSATPIGPQNPYDFPVDNAYSRTALKTKRATLAPQHTTNNLGQHT